MRRSRGYHKKSYYHKGGRSLNHRRGGHKAHGKRLRHYGASRGGIRL